MNEWLDDIARLGAEGDYCVIVTVAGVRGSAPREPGAKMIVTARATIGTVGGGQLEYQCTRIAIDQLLQNGSDAKQRLSRRFPLGTNCGQCCGGVVDILFERVALCAGGWLTELGKLHDERCPVVLITPIDCSSGPQLVTGLRYLTCGERSEVPGPIVAAARQMLVDRGSATSLDGFLLEPVVPTSFNIAVFGAGHVGAATVDVLSKLECRIRWIDSRRNIFPASLPRNVTAVESGNPAGEVAAMPRGSFYLVITHSHPLDFEICGQVLHRGDSAYCGLIGSAAKRRRFERNLRKQGMPDDLFDQLTCPIGVAGISSKKPADIAIAVSAELLRIRDAAAAANRGNARVPESWDANVHVL